MLMGVAGVIYLIEYGEFGTIYGNLISFSFWCSVIVAAFSILEEGLLFALLPLVS